MLPTRALGIVTAGLLLGGLLTTAASAGPEGEQVVHGDVQFSRDGHLTQIQASHNSIINYQSFDIQAQETVQFIQPGASARVLNRILGNDPTQIDGTLLANGQVYFLNPAGIFVGANALIDVAGLYAAAGSISDEDYLNRIDRFTDLSGPVENLGAIQAEFVHLLGAQVANYGSIVAQGGIVTLVAGDAVYIAEAGGRVLIKLESTGAPHDSEAPGVLQSGEIDARGGQVTLKAGDLYSLAIRHPGKTRAHDILLEGGADGVVNVAGMLDASDADADQLGGTIAVLGERVALTGARLDASGDAGGGTVLVGGDTHGQGEVRTASETFVSPDSEIRADALDQGDGGTVVVWADDSTRSYGTISARGGARSGDGGFVETSGKRYLEVTDAPDLSAPSGRGGTWLLDPMNITIVDELQPGDPGDGSRITDDVIEEVLNQGADVVITTGADPDPGELGNIVQEADARIEKTAGAEASLSLLAANQIVLNGGIESSAGPLNVVLVADDAQPGDLLPGIGTIFVNADIQTGGGSATLDASTVIDVNARIDTAGGAATFGLHSAAGSQTRLSNDIVTAGGDLHLATDTILDGTATHANQRLDAGSGEIRATGSLTKISGGQLTLVAATTIVGADIKTQGGLRLGQNTLLEGTGEHANQRLDAGSGKLRAGGPLSKTSAGNLTLASTNELDLSGAVEVAQGSLTVEGNIEAPTLSARDNIELVDSVLALEITAELGDLNIGGFANIEGDISAGKDIDIGEFANVQGNITAGGDVDLFEGVTAQSIQAGGDVDIGSFANLEAALTAGGDVFLFEGIEAGGDISAGGDLIIDEQASVNGSISAGNDLEIGGDALVTNGLNATTGSVSIDGFAEVGAEGIRAGEDITLDNGAIITGDLSAGGDISLTEGSDSISGEGGIIDVILPILIDGAIVSGGDVDVFGSASVTNAIHAGGSVFVDEDITTTSINATRGDITVDGRTSVPGDLSAGGDISLNGDINAESIIALGYIDVAQLIEVDGPVDVSVTNAISGAEGIAIEGNVSSASLSSTNGDISIDGSATVSGDISAGGDISLNEFLDDGPVDPVTVGGAISSGGSISVEGSVSADSITATDDIDVFSGSASVTNAINAGDSVTIEGSTTAASVNAGEGDITLEGFVTISGDVTAGDSIDLLEFASIGGQLSAGADLFLAEGANVTGVVEARDGDLDVSGSLIAGGDVTAGGLITIGLRIPIRDNEGNIIGFNTSGSLIAGGNVSAGDDIDIADQTDVDGDITTLESILLGGQTEIGGDVRAGPDGDVEIEGVANVGGTISAGVDVFLSEDVTAESITAGDILDASGSVTTTGSVRAGDEIVISDNASVGSMRAQDIDVGGVLTSTGAVNAVLDVLVSEDADVVSMDAGGDIAIDGSLTSSGSVSAGLDIEVGEDAAVGSLAAGGDFLIGGALTATGDVSSVRDADATRIETAGRLDVGGSLSVGDSVIAGTDVAVGLDADADSISAGEDITIGGSADVPNGLVAGGNVVLNGDATVGKIEAGNDIELNGQDVSVVVDEAGDDDFDEDFDEDDLGDAQVAERADEDTGLGAVRAGHDVKIMGSASVENDVTAGNDVLVRGHIEAGSLVATAGNVSVEGEGSATVSGDIAAGSDVLLTSSGVQPGNAVTVSGAVSAGHNAVLEGQVDLGSLSVGNDLDVAGTAVIQGDLVVGNAANLITSPELKGNASIGGPLVLKGDLAAAGNLVLNGSATLDGTGDQTLSAGGQLMLSGVDKSNGGLNLIGSSIAFNSTIESQGTLDLEATGSSAREDGANLFMQTGDLALISSEGDVIMHEGDRLFVGGNLDVRAGGGRALLADISADELLSVVATEIELLGPRADADSDAGFLTKEGVARVNYFAAKIDFATTPPGQSQIFGARNGRADIILQPSLPPPGDPLVAFDVIITGGTLASSGDAIPQVVGTPINRDAEVELPAILPSSPPIYEQLLAVGAQRPLWSDELIAYLDCAALAQCVPGAPSAIHDARLATVPAQSAMLSYRELFLQPEPMRSALQHAVNDFRSQRPVTPMTGEALRAFLESDLAFTDALAYLNRLALLLDEIEQLNLSEREPGDTRLVLLDKLQLMGIDVHDLDGAIRAAATNDPTLTDAG